MEEKIRSIIASILELDNSAMDEIYNADDLCAHGLNSLNAIEMIVYVEEEFNVYISEEDLYIDNFNTIEKVIQMVAVAQAAIANK